MLHEQTDNGNANPTTEAKKDWFATGFNEFDDVGVESDCCHSEDNEKLTNFLHDRGEAYRSNQINMKVSKYCCQNGSKNKV